MGIPGGRRSGLGNSGESTMFLGSCVEIPETSEDVLSMAMTQDPKLEIPTISFCPIFLAYCLGDIPPKYGLGTGPPLNRMLRIPIDMLLSEVVATLRLKL